MTITNVLILAAVVVCSFIALMGVALSAVQWRSEIRALQLLDKETIHPETR